MTRRSMLGGVLILGMVGCDLSDSPSESSTPAPSTATAAQVSSTPPAAPAGIIVAKEIIDGDPPHFLNTIIMTANGGVPGVPETASCVGTVTMYRLVGVQRKHKIRWHIQNDAHNACPDLQISQVQLRFANAIMSHGIGGGQDALDTLAPVGNHTYIEGRVHTSATRAPNNPHAKYVVYYLGVQASPDPELDINGDCPNCGPGGGS